MGECFGIVAVAAARFEGDQAYGSVLVVHCSCTRSVQSGTGASRGIDTSHSCNYKIRHTQTSSGFIGTLCTPTMLEYLARMVNDPKRLATA